MKLSHLLFLAFLGTSITMIACNEKKDQTTTEDPTTVSPEGMMEQDPSATAASVTGDASFHYVCPNACKGGGGANAGKCPICGTDMVHNQAFHAQPTGADGGSAVNPIQIDPTTGGTAVTPPPPAAKNASGQFHYTCPKGHEGGAASAGNCAKCGGPLEHNQAYHNN